MTPTEKQEIIDEIKNNLKIELSQTFTRGDGELPNYHTLKVELLYAFDVIASSEIFVELGNKNV